MSIAPTTAILTSPCLSLLTATSKAAREDAHAASTVQLVPPKLNLFATLPAETFGRIPAKLSLVHFGSNCST